jgi:dTMP kinase
MNRARFVTFEGGEGSGKSTQVAMLGQRLRAAGVECLLTREPGGSPDAEVIRQLLVTGKSGRWSTTSEILLNYAARESHLNDTIRPALLDGQLVICDRFADSTRAYQGFAGKGDLELIERLDEAIVGSTQPDLTFVFDLDPRVGLDRASARGGDDRFERKGIEFHGRLREGYLHVVEAFPRRCQLIDASAGIDEIAHVIRKALAPLLGKKIS